MNLYGEAGRRLFWVSLFGVAFGFVEASVVVYLRALYYPDGFSFPLKTLANPILAIEIAREGATIVMLAAAGMMAGKKAWERFALFMVAFGFWDIFYYIWLRATLGWPQTLTDWDILFLIPIPWIGPVVAPVVVAGLMVIMGGIIVVRLAKGELFLPGFRSWLAGALGTIVLLYSFMNDTAATFQGGVPEPYHYELLLIAIILYAAGFFAACDRKRTRQ